jgi:hypothetical protein
MANHESVIMEIDQALAIATEGYQDAERAIEAARFVRIAELLKPTEAQWDESDDPIMRNADGTPVTWGQVHREAKDNMHAWLNTRQLKSGETLYDGKEKGGSKAALL